MDSSVFCGLYGIFLEDGLELKRAYRSLDTIISNDMVELIANLAIVCIGTYKMIC